MSTYDILIEKGIEKGRQEGIEKGIEKGMELKASEKNYTFTISLLMNSDFDDEKIAKLVGVTIEYVKNLREGLNEKK